MYGYTSDRWFYHLAQFWSRCNGENEQYEADVSAAAAVENPACLLRADSP
jgi:hypothetical protein